MYTLCRWCHVHVVLCTHDAGAAMYKWYSIHVLHVVLCACRTCCCVHVVLWACHICCVVCMCTVYVHFVVVVSWRVCILLYSVYVYVLCFIPSVGVCIVYVVHHM